MLNGSLFSSETINGWGRLVDWYDSNITTGEQWIFRGVRDSHWRFVASLERAVKDFEIDTRCSAFLRSKAD